MKRFLEKKTAGLHKCRCKLVMHYGKYWWSKMDENEWNMKKNAVFPLIENIHSKQDLTDFMIKQQNIRDDFDNCQYKFFLIPDYSVNESVIIYKAHHCFSDGMGASMFFLMISDQYVPD